MPEWLRAQLIDQGHLSESGLARTARILRHRPCGLPTLAGLDSHLAALEARVDLGELTAFGEAAALLSGRRTYEYNIIRRQLSRRDRYRIAGKPAGSGQATVFAEHRCEEPIPASWCLPPTQTPPTKPTTESKEIPF